ncbi:MAG: metallophosphoesterase [Alphaproteobacteria bacterium]|nr:metallophosphoesterase [Alphaproteobacteria bacterium]
MKWLKWIFIMASTLLLYGVIYEPYTLKITKYQLDNESLAGLKIVFATDFHIAPYEWEKRRLLKIISTINEQEADLVILGGDYVNRHSRRSTLSPRKIADALQQIKAPKVAVLGNHDSYYGKNKVKSALENVGIPVLDNQNIKLILRNKQVYIAGIADYYTDKPDIRTALKNTGVPLILVTHSPDGFANLKSSADVVFAGHTHGGQIVMPLWGPLLVPTEKERQYINGLFYKNNTPLIVSAGLGTSIVPIRFNNPPEIVAVTFK